MATSWRCENMVITSAPSARAVARVVAVCAVLAVARPDPVS
jgi:hypothetical protein